MIDFYGRMMRCARCDKVSLLLYYVKWQHGLGPPNDVTLCGECIKILEEEVTQESAMAAMMAGRGSKVIE